MSITSSQESKSIIKEYTLAEDISRGDVVRFRPDGTVDRVFGGAFPYSESFGSSLQAVPIATNKFLIVCLNNLNEVACTVANVQGTTITYGAEFKFSTQGKMSAVRLQDDKVLITYLEVAKTQYEAIVATVTGDDVAFAVPFLFVPTVNLRSVLALADNKVLVAMIDSAGANVLAVLDITGTTTFNLGSNFVYTAGTVSFLNFTLISLDKVILFYHDGTNDLRSIVAKIAVANITLGTEEIFSIEGSGAPPGAAAQIPGGNLPGSSGGFGLGSVTSDKMATDKVLLGIDPGGISAQLLVVTVADTSISFGVAVDSGTQGSLSIAGVDIDKAVLAHQSGANVVIVTGSAVQVGPLGAMGATSAIRSEVFVTMKVEANKVILASGGTARIGIISGITIAFDTIEEFIGIVNETGVLGEIKGVVVAGIYTSGTTLEPGKYFINNFGRIEKFTSGTGVNTGGLGNKAGAVSASSIIGKAIGEFDFLIIS